MEHQYFNKNLIFTQKILDFELLLNYLKKIQISDINHIMEVERQHTNSSSSDFFMIIFLC